jgi:hypothetical protein
MKWFRARRNRKWTENMKYPLEPKSHEWFMTTLTGSRSDSNKLSSVFIVFCRAGAGGHTNKFYEHGYILLNDPDFRAKYLELLTRGKEQIDLLNLQPDEDGINGTGGGVCANCQLQRAMPNDFLCNACRAT